MKLSTICLATVYLAATTFASPRGTPQNRGNGGQPGAVSAQTRANVTETIYRWLSDIEVVNNFVDTTSASDGPAVISSKATTAFAAAQNEGTSNDILQQAVTLDASGQAAAQALIAKFGIIGPAINDTIFNPGDLQKNLDAINGARCPPPVGADAISEEGAVQAAAAKAVGIRVPPPATPTACFAAAATTNCG